MAHDSEPLPAPPAHTAPVTFAHALRVWSRIGWLGFGGPAGQIALMHRELVEQRRWISEGRFLHALNFCMLLPGPEAQQLAIYIGWLMHRTRGGIAAGVLFVLPGAIVLGVLSWLYVRYGQLPAISALFFGLKAAVLAVVVEAVQRLGRRALKTRFLGVVAGAAFVAIFALHVPFPWIVASAALLGWIVQKARPRWLPPPVAKDAPPDAHYVVDRMIAAGEATHTLPSWTRAVRTLLVCGVLWTVPIALAAWWLGAGHIVVREGLFFSQAAVVTFGGAYAVLAFVAQRAVGSFGWLHPGEMVDGLAMAETTPGPLIMVLQFVGFVAAYRFPGGLGPWESALLGAAMTTWVTFVPCFLFVFVGAPYVESLRRHAAVHAALGAVTAAVVGVVLNLSVWFALHVLFGSLHSVAVGPLRLDVPTWTTWHPVATAIALGAAVAMLKFHVGLGRTLAACALLGLAAWRFGIA